MSNLQCAVSVSLLLILGVPAWADDGDTGRVRASAERSIGLLQKVAANWSVGCFSCHHQAMPMIALEEARRHGLTVDEKAAHAASQKAFAPLSQLDEAVQDRFLIDPAVSEGYMLVAAQAAGVEPSVSTAAYARRIANYQRGDGHWPTFDARPPSSNSLFASTAIALRAASLYMPAQLETDKRAMLEKARHWLLSTPARNNEDRTFQLLGAAWTAVGEAERRRLAEALIARQQRDGGWTSADGVESDAYATAQSLYALRAAGGISPDDARWRRGLEWLLGRQSADGSWKVESWIDTPAQVSPPYMETGFPYGHHQFLSCAATSWAVMALASALPEKADAAKPAAVLAARPANVPGWAETALFGSAKELEEKLKAGLDANSATPLGTSVLMMAAHDADKVRLLLSRGAKVNARAKSGYDALMLASLHHGSGPAVRLLLQAGASPAPRTGIMFNASALMLATMSGDTEVAELLLRHGASVTRKMNLIGTLATTPLSAATGFDYAGMIRLLVKHGAQVDELDPKKMSNVSWAALSHKNEALRTLLDLGGNPAQRDDYGLTPLQHTQGIRYMSPDAAEILKARLQPAPASAAR